MSAVRGCLIALLLGLPIQTGCSDGGSSTGPIGSACVEDDGCAPGFCNDGVCSRNCEAHEDCGCREGTTNADIEAGECAVACSGDQCRRVCESDLDCEGDTQCQDPGTFGTCE